MRKVLTTIFVIASLSAQAWDWWPLPMAQPDTCRDSLSYIVSISATAGSGTYSAFWMQSGEHGCEAISPYSGALRAAIIKPATRPNRWFDYDGAVDLQGTVHSNLPVREELMPAGRFPIYQTRNGNFIVRQCYGHLRLYIFDGSIGVLPLTDGMDVPLSSGSLLFSNNAPAIPMIRIGIERWTAIPGLYGYMEIKGGVVHAWMSDYMCVPHTKLHYKWAGLQLGGKLPVNVSYEFHHAAQWGGYLDGEDLGNSWSAYKHIFLARNGGGNSYNESYGFQGNHIISQQLAVTAKGEGWNVKAYWQNLGEVNYHFIGTAQNIADGRWGVCATQQVWPYIHTLTMEYVCTTDQSGPLHDQDGIIYAGNERYYYNFIYMQGWNYYLRTIGTPLITSPLYNNNDLPYTLNNRIQAWHVGIGGDIYGYRYRLMGTYVRNYGYYVRNDWYDMLSDNTALMLDVSKRVEKAWGLDFGVRLAADFGTQWGNQVSAMIRISKQGLITSYK